MVVGDQLPPRLGWSYIKSWRDGTNDERLESAYATPPVTTPTHMTFCMNTPFAERTSALLVPRARGLSFLVAYLCGGRISIKEAGVDKTRPCGCDYSRIQISRVRRNIANIATPGTRLRWQK